MINKTNKGCIYKKVFKKLFSVEKEDFIGEYAKPHTREIEELYTSQKALRVIKSRILR
jgi:hypothetical protein